MNKNFKLYSILWAFSLAIFNVIVFIVPNEIAGFNKFGGAFWAGYVFITLAFVGQLATAFFALKEENLTKLFYNLSMLSVSRVGLILTLVIGTLCMIIPNLPNWVGIIICFAILGFTAIAVFKANFAADLVAEKDKEIKAQTLFIKSLTADAQSLIAQAKSPEVKAECKKVYEAVRYSDPMSNDALASIEGDITINFSKFTEAVISENSDTVATLADKIIILLGDRNKKCRLLK